MPADTFETETGSMRDILSKRHKSSGKGLSSLAGVARQKLPLPYLLLLFCHIAIAPFYSFFL
jgi:hypothetical protein